MPPHFGGMPSYDQALVLATRRVTLRRRVNPAKCLTNKEDSIWRVVDAWSPLPLARQEVRTAGRGAPSRVEGLYHISMSMVWSGAWFGHGLIRRKT
jgi:hypothetical protein